MSTRWVFDTVHKRGFLGHRQADSHQSFCQIVRWFAWVTLADTHSMISNTAATSSSYVMMILCRRGTVSKGHSLLDKSQSGRISQITHACCIWNQIGFAAYNKKLMNNIYSKTSAGCRNFIHVPWAWLECTVVAFFIRGWSTLCKRLDSKKKIKIKIQ